MSPATSRSPLHPAAVPSVASHRVRRVVIVADLGGYQTAGLVLQAIALLASIYYAARTVRDARDARSEERRRDREAVVERRLLRALDLVGLLDAERPATRRQATRPARTC